MKCKNCGHEIAENEKGRLLHFNFATIKNRQRPVAYYNIKCLKCGCTKPEPVTK